MMRNRWFYTDATVIYPVNGRRAFQPRMNLFFVPEMLPPLLPGQRHHSSASAEMAASASPNS